MPHFQLLYPTENVCAADLQGKDHVVTIAKIERKELKGEGGEKLRKVLFTLKGKEKPWLVPVTNARTIAGLYGEDWKDWIGKSITIYPTTCMCHGKRVGCIRVRATVPPAEPSGAAEPEPTTRGQSQPPDDGDGKRY